MLNITLPNTFWELDFHESKEFYVLCLLMNPQHLEQFRARGQYLMNIG